MINLKGRSVSKQVASEPGKTILDIALKNDVDWGFSCTRGTCARCRCLITEGLDQLAKPTDEEFDRLEPEELEEGFRLGCQAIVKSEGSITAVNKTYF
ncbi:2Fe-2S iron-sulfur cluster-binding protein [Gorillibacterium massiliense]|uniref:2Fe-2S iron-sulfur cluster-binding protein n=1 Tax=Gorillibacterium massiliense TaxID=1280390 RepID=UPI0004B7D783|nr:2Fe-2S iron-sulfur cluster-binding protein [Gorillibacterium massiliense]